MNKIRKSAVPLNTHDPWSESGAVQTLNALTEGLKMEKNFET
jgi:hypothetical protein